jgi:hypothetical protein
VPYVPPPSVGRADDDFGSGEKKEEPHTLSTHHLALHDLSQSPLEWIVARIEVTDTGCGIKPEDMVHCKLFCGCFSFISAPSGSLTKQKLPSIRLSREDNKVSTLFWLFATDVMSIVRWQGNRTWPGPGEANSQAEWRKAGSPIASWTWLNLLGRIA